MNARHSFQINEDIKNKNFKKIKINNLIKKSALQFNEHYLNYKINKENFLYHL